MKQQNIVERKESQERLDDKSSPKEETKQRVNAESLIISSFLSGTASEGKIIPDLNTLVIEMGFETYLFNPKIHESKGNWQVWLNKGFISEMKMDMKRLVDEYCITDSDGKIF